MEREFTPGAMRALAAAATWQLGDAQEGLRLVSILMGLLAEPECRAAMVLRDLGIDEELLLARWPELHRVTEPPAIALDTPPVFHEEVRDLFLAVDRYMEWGDWPPIISTEHLLLGLAGCDHPVAAWLRERGLDLLQLRQQILERYGTAATWREPKPLPFPIEENVADGPASEQVGGESEEPSKQETSSQTQGASSDGLSLAGRLSAKDQSWSGSESGKPGQQAPESARPSLSQEMGLYRLVDAAINRALEGLRVVEDYVRFVLDDPFLVGQLKTLRHSFAEVVSRLPMAVRLAARETQADVGTQIKHTHELSRQTLEDVLDANISRVREAMRSIEECAKILAPELALQIEQLRYQSYTLHRALRISAAARERLRHARLYVLVDARPTPEEFQRLVQSLIEAGVHVLQLREKRADDRTVLQRARLLRSLTRGTQTLFIMNDRPDLAALSDADGVHVGQEELTVKDARSIVGARALVGVSTHNIEQARQAVLDGADYIGCGPTFPSQTKQFAEFAGLEFLRQVAGEIRLPAFAIGGINEENLDAVLATGFRRVAVSAAVIEAPDPAAAARRLLARLQTFPLPD